MKSSLPLAVLLLPLAVSSPALAQTESSEPEPPPPMTWEPTGSFFSRYELRQGYEPVAGSPTLVSNDEGSDFVRYRARLGLVSNRHDIGNGLELRVRFLPEAAGLWNAGGDTLDDPSLFLHEGAVELYGAATRLEVGRFEMNYGDQLVIGPVGWHQSGRAFDGVRFRYQSDANSPWYDAFFTTLDEGATAGWGDDIGAGDTWFGGVYAGLGKLLSDSLELDVYALSRQWPAVDEHDAEGNAVENDAAFEETLGLRVKNRAGSLDYRLEAGYQLGQRRIAGEAVDSSGYQADAEVGYSLLGGDLRVAVEGFVASGDDPETADQNEAWFQLYPTAHKWLGFMDVVPARSNITGGAFHLSHQTTERLRIALDFHSFMRPEPVVVDGPDGTYGNEVDLGAELALGRGVSLRGAWDVFLMNEDFVSEGTDTTLHFAELELRATLPVPR